MAACNDVAAVVPVHEKQEVVPIHYNELKDNNYSIPNMRKLMEKLQKQSQAMKSAQQEISSLKKQLSETTGFFKGKVRKSLEDKIEQAEKQEKRIHTDTEQTVKSAGYPDVQSFAKT